MSIFFSRTLRIVSSLFIALAIIIVGFAAVAAPGLLMILIAVGGLFAMAYSLARLPR